MLSGTKITPQNDSYHPRNAHLQAQISNLSSQNEIEHFQIMHEEGEGNVHEDGFPLQIQSRLGMAKAAGSTTEEKSALSSRKHLGNRHSQINFEASALDAMNVLRPELHDDGAGNYLPLPEQPRQRKKSTTYEEKADLFHLPQASSLKPNLLISEDNSSPVHAPNGNLVIRPHVEEDYNPYSQQTRTSKLKQEDARYARKKEDQQQPQPELAASSDKKKVRRLPSMSVSRNSHLLASHESSTIILNKNKNEPQLRMPDALNSHDAQLEMQLQPLLAPVARKTVYRLLRQQQFGVNYIHPDFSIVSSDGNTLISAKKQFCHLNSHYNIATSEFGSELVLGSLRGNFGGTEFNLYRLRAQQEELVATITYESACGADFRKSEVYIKTADHNDPVFHRETLRQNLKQLFYEGHVNIARLASKDPTWNAATKCYSLNFGGKGKHPSTKNMILVGEGEPQRQVLSFCKAEADSFHLEVGQPLSLLVTMGVLMSSFDFKLLCQ